MSFEALQLVPPLVRAVADEGYTTPTPIQVQAIPSVLAGRDLLGIAQTGTGKTAAFALPILQRLMATPPKGQRPIRVLVLSPTRELCSQIADSFARYGKHTTLRSAVIFGGVGQEPQVQMLRRGVDVLVAAPGRLLDLMNQGFVRLEHLECFVLDEADRMLDMGFIHDVRRVISALPAQRQNLLFSATMPPDVQDIADRILKDPVKVEVAPQATTAEKVAQTLYFVEKSDKRHLLVHLLGDKNLRRALVFTRTKHGANRVAEALEKARISAAAIHGNKSQGARERALEGFRRGDVRVLVATDIAARGIDVDDVTHVINFDLPNIPESYVHRIGRTARAGASGMAISFCEMEERPYLVDIERLIRQHVPRVDDHPFRSPTAPPPLTNLQGRGGGAGGGGGGGGGGGRGGRPAPRPAPPRHEQRGRDERRHGFGHGHEPRAEREPARDGGGDGQPSFGFHGRKEEGGAPRRPVPPPRQGASGAGGGGGGSGGGNGGGGAGGGGDRRRRRRRRRPVPGAPVQGG